MGRHTITGMLTAGGRQFMDWSRAYRLFSEGKVAPEKLFDVCCGHVLDQVASHDYITAHMDDTLLKKTGKKIPGTGWRRDPLGPPFHTNFIWGQRFIQLSMALPQGQRCCGSRAIPIDWHHCPTAVKPGKRGTPDQWEAYKQAQKTARLSHQGSQRIQAIRNKLDAHGADTKTLLLSVDGSYTNREIFKGLPERVTLIGRIRKDTKLYRLPEKNENPGRKRVYGEPLPTPEQIRQSEAYSWQKVPAFAAGKTHNFQVKIVRPVRWRAAGEKHTLQLVVIRPLGYRLTKGSRILYRQPAYLICSDPDLAIEQLLQSYLWRWEIEVNFREEKTLLGCGQAQVRNPESIVRVPAFIVAMYGLIQLAGHQAFKHSSRGGLPRPKWYKKTNGKRYTAGDLLNNFRAQLWTHSLGHHFSGFVDQELKTQSRRNKANPCTSAMFYMRN